MADSPLTLDDLAAMDLSVLSGIGNRKAAALRTLGVESLNDLIHYFPRRYVDRSDPQWIRDLRSGENALVIGTIERVETRRTRSRRAMVTVDVSDRSGRIRCSFFNQPWRQQQLGSREGSEVALFGRVDEFRGSPQMANPLVDLIGDQTGRIVPIYPLTEKSGLSSAEIGSWVAQIIRRSSKRGFADPLDDTLRSDLELVDRYRALSGIHFPSTMAELRAARTRLIVDELLRIQISLVSRKRQIEKDHRGFQHLPDGPDSRSVDLLGAFYSSLPYELTGAQSAAIAQISKDLSSPVPMHRLLQGDVGSGKTLVALVALLTVVQAGHQGAFMAPTEVLAEQHAASLRTLLSGLTIDDPALLLGNRPVNVDVMTGKTRAATRRRILDDLSAGRTDILVGTHALLEDQVNFASLGLVVIDEQHRFGVEQRAALRSPTHGALHPDVLVMTATPIPRTAAMTVYGDLDVTVLDELPPGRTPIVTSWASTPDDEATAWELVRSEVAANRQSYVVCPLVEDSDKIEAASAEATFERLSSGELAGLTLGLLHGRMTAEDKAQTMDRFRAGEIDVMVATTVIEVGVDVPNASVMVILDADRFGLAQLHQLRGRVGRGSQRSYCILVTDGDVTPDGTARLDAMVSTTDGFELSEIDLGLRGEGTIMGSHQKGRSDLRLASLQRDAKWVSIARKLAFEIVDDSRFDSVRVALLNESQLMIGESEAEFLEKN